MNRLAAVLVLSLLALSGVRADTVYRWVDAQGNVHYSDQPHPGAKKIKVQPAQTYAPAAAALPAASEPPAWQAPSPPAAVKFRLISPADQQTFWNVHEITVSVSVSPPPGEDARIVYHLDDQSLGPTAQLSATFKDVVRGAHTASASLTLPDGETLTAGPVTFYIHQASILTHKPPL